MKIVKLNESTQKFFELFLNPKNSPLGPQKVKKDPKIKSKSIVSIEKTKKTKVVICSCYMQKLSQL